MTTQTEVIRRIYDTEEDVCFEIRLNPDGFRYIEFVTPDDKSKAYYGDIRLTFGEDMALQIGQALISTASESLK